MKKISLLALIVLSFMACKNDTSKPETKPESSIKTQNTESENNKKEPISFVNAIETAHKKEAFLKEAAVQFELILSFGGNEILNGLATFSTDSSEGKIEMTNGDVIIYKEDQVYYSPSITNTQRIRFNAYTWSYFFLFPYKLSDEGTIWNSYPETQLGGEKYSTKKLSFEANTGDAPDDWYVVYANPNSNLVEVAAYIVTAGKTKAEAEADPHAIKYEDFIGIKNIPFARKWTFWEWDSELGLTQQIGEGTIKNITFLNDDKLFEVPQHFKKI
ncbi:hypothetical protein SAMN04487989_103212 [Bizionia echini]|uniref:Uncharacterized protein n=1 Tax=Bizionia echini TaxID=649333 RepID=A0A1I5BLP4_9FLAO|nr:DUF6503 family protein [Bizionia echini]SFN75550.1 hypothetical protein SAMN04487989_103212 [Bizionia echini]